MEAKERCAISKRNWLLRNREKQRAIVIARRLKLYEWYHELKTGLSCSVCGEDHPACIDFHHRDPSEKEISIPNAIRNGWSKDRVLKEMDKCEILCSNCHRKLHWPHGEVDITARS